jgi:hypothetical protein
MQFVFPIITTHPAQQQSISSIVSSRLAFDYRFIICHRYLNKADIPGIYRVTPRQDSIISSSVE